MHSPSQPLDSASSASGSEKSSASYVILLSTIAAISGFLFGFDTAVINGVLLFLRKQFALTNLQTEVAASSLLLGCLIGAASASLLGDRYGRKKSLILAALLFAISALGSAVSNTITVFAVARFAGGLAIGLASALTPVYIAEIAPAKNRGKLVSLNQLAIVIGILFAYLINWQLSRLGDSSWRWMLATAAVPSIIFFVGLLVIPESPRWLITRGKKDEGERVLARIVGPTAAREQVESVERAASSEQGSWSELFEPGVRARLVVAIALAVFSQITGINTVLYYGSIIVSEHFSGQSSSTALAANVIIGGVNLVFTIIAMLFLDRWGRRGILMTASGGMAAALAALVISFRIPSLPPTILLLEIVIYVAFFAFGMGPGVWLYIAEIFPTKIRGRAAAMATSSLWAGTLVVTFTFLSLVKTAGIGGTFAIYSALSAICFLYIWKFVPETRGRTLEQIQEHWQR
jgi:SP family arabinose:H+ symporter-like MFS transporter